VFPSGLQKAQWFAGFCWKPKVEPRSAHKPPTNGFVCWFEPRRIDWKGLAEKNSEENEGLEGDVQTMEPN
jgi:hypothetical protein